MTTRRQGTELAVLSSGLEAVVGLAILLLAFRGHSSACLRHRPAPAREAKFFARVQGVQAPPEFFDCFAVITVTIVVGGNLSSSLRQAKEIDSVTFVMSQSL